jgi:hypothetical protein
VKQPIQRPNTSATIGDRLADELVDGKSPVWQSPSDVGGDLSTEIAFQRAIEHALKLVSHEKTPDGMLKLAQATQFLSMAKSTYFTAGRRR